MKNTNIILLSFLVAVLTFSFIQYSDAASASDNNVKGFCDRISPFYKVDKSGTLEKYENHPFLKLCSFHSGSQASHTSSSYSTKSSSNSNDYTKNVATNYWAEKSKSKITSNDYTKNVATNYWAEKFAKSTHNFDVPKSFELKKFEPIKTHDYTQTFKPINNYKSFDNSFYDNQMNNRYSPNHPINNHFSSNHHQPTYTWSYVPNPFLGER